QRKGPDMPPRVRQGTRPDAALQLQPGQAALTPAQQVEARRFAEAAIERQLSTEPVDEPEAEACLRQAYQVAGLAPPQRISWLDGPLPLVQGLIAPSGRASANDRVWYSVATRVHANLGDRVSQEVRRGVSEQVFARVERSVRDQVGV